jgi:SAM-dependent methyltransferase/uncharacterized protein YbaR (Trm112 family)
MPDICDYEAATYRTSFWENKGREYEDQVEHGALKSLLPRGDRIIDLGAGFGRMADLYKDYKQVVLLDYSHNHLEYARDHWGLDRFIYVCADIYHLPFTPAQFDTAVMIRTLHHMDAPLAAIQQVRLILRQHGTYIVEYTNKRSLKTISKWMLRRSQPFPFNQDPVKFDELYYGFHPDFVDDKLKVAGFAPQKRLAASYFRVKLLKRIIPTPLLVKMDAALRGTGRIGLFSPSIFVKSEAVSQDTGETGQSMWRCPSCCVMDTLEETPDALICSNCGNHWEIKDGIYDFRAAAASSRHVQVDATTGWGMGH